MSGPEDRLREALREAQRFIDFTVRQWVSLLSMEHQNCHGTACPHYGVDEERFVAVEHAVDAAEEALRDRAGVPPPLDQDRAELGGVAASVEGKTESGDVHLAAGLLTWLKQECERLHEALGILTKACEAGAYVGRTSPAVIQAREALSFHAPAASPASRSSGPTDPDRAASGGFAAKSEDE